MSLMYYLMQSCRRAGTASRLTRLQESSYFQGHQQFVQNAAPVTAYHRQCIQHFIDTGRVKTEAASAAVRALLLQTPSRPAQIMKQFRCCPPFPATFDSNYKKLHQCGCRCLGQVHGDSCNYICVRHKCSGPRRKCLSSVQVVVFV